jgi:hypothetical protein
VFDRVLVCSRRFSLDWVVAQLKLYDIAEGQQVVIDEIGDG